jgi:hypothetical protein
MFLPFLRMMGIDILEQLEKLEQMELLDSENTQEYSLN